MSSRSQPPPRDESQRPIIFHSAAQFGATVLAYVQDQLEVIGEEFENLHETTSKLEEKLEEANEQIESLRQTTSSQQKQLDVVNFQLEQPKRVMGATSDTTIEMVLEKIRPLESILGLEDQVAGRLATIEGRLEAIISMSSAAGEETEVLTA
jgi:chromosome segregation ATPase